MKFRTWSNVERTQKYGGSKYKMTYVRSYIIQRTSEASEADSQSCSIEISDIIGELA